MTIVHSVVTESDINKVIEVLFKRKERRISDKIDTKGSELINSFRNTYRTILRYILCPVVNTL